MGSNPDVDQKALAEAKREARERDWPGLPSPERARPIGMYFLLAFGAVIFALVIIGFVSF